MSRRPPPSFVPSTVCTIAAPGTPFCVFLAPFPLKDAEPQSGDLGCWETDHNPHPFSVGDQPLCSIPIENILAVERLEEESFRMKNVSDRLALFPLAHLPAPLQIQAWTLPPRHSFSTWPSGRTYQKVGIWPGTCWTNSPNPSHVPRCSRLSSQSVRCTSRPTTVWRPRTGSTSSPK